MIPTSRAQMSSEKSNNRKLKNKRGKNPRTFSIQTVTCKNGKKKTIYHYADAAVTRAITNGESGNVVRSENAQFEI